MHGILAPCGFCILNLWLLHISLERENIWLVAAEHERMIEAYNLMNQKLQQSLIDHDNFENTIRNLKVCCHFIMKLYMILFVFLFYSFL